MAVAQPEILHTLSVANGRAEACGTDATCAQARKASGTGPGAVPTMKWVTASVHAYPSAAFGALLESIEANAPRIWYEPGARGAGARAYHALEIFWNVRTVGGGIGGEVDMADAVRTSSQEPRRDREDEARQEDLHGDPLTWVG